MAKKSSIAREKQRQKLVALKWEKRATLKKVISDPNVSDEERLEAQIKLNQLPRNSSKIRLRNRCELTGRCRGYLRKFKLSRLCFREMANAGLIPGIVKASW
ncbi:MAG: 30S ribosomal protein S14 [Chlamydiota bacterium]